MHMVYHLTGLTLSSLISNTPESKVHWVISAPDGPHEPCYLRQRDDGIWLTDRFLSKCVCGLFFSRCLCCVCYSVSGTLGRLSKTHWSREMVPSLATSRKSRCATMWLTARRLSWSSCMLWKPRWRTWSTRWANSWRPCPKPPRKHQ